MLAVLTPRKTGGIALFLKAPIAPPCVTTTSLQNNQFYTVVRGLFEEATRVDTYLNKNAEKEQYGRHRSPELSLCFDGNVN